MGKAFDIARGLLDADSAGVEGDSRLVEWRRGAQQWTERFREELMTPAPGTVCGPEAYETDESVLDRPKRVSAKSKTTTKKKTAAKKRTAAKVQTTTKKKAASKKPAGKKRR
jgi:hypothetical protein